MLVTSIPLHEHMSQFLKYLETDFLHLGYVYLQLNRYCQIVLPSGDSNLHSHLQTEIQHLTLSTKNLIANLVGWEHFVIVILICISLMISES